jgi:hypothetical protein
MVLTYKSHVLNLINKHILNEYDFVYFFPYSNAFIVTKVLIGWTFYFNFVEWIDLWRHVPLAIIMLNNKQG